MTHTAETTHKDSNNKTSAEHSLSTTHGDYSPVDTSTTVEPEGVELQLTKETDPPTAEEQAIVAVVESESEATACIESTAPESVFRESSASKLIAFSEKFNRYSAPAPHTDIAGPA